MYIEYKVKGYRYIEYKVKGYRYKEYKRLKGTGSKNIKLRDKGI